MHQAEVAVLALLAAFTLLQQLADQAVAELHLEAEHLKEKEQLVIQAAILP
jgi:hypothetical protein